MPEKNVITVSGLTQYIKSMLESDVNLKSFTVSGEISNLTIHKTGHLYFAIKDESAVINAVMFRGSAASLDFKPENGMKIIAGGRISVFEPAGRYQVIVTSMSVDGIGDLYVAFEKLKNKLQKEGLFDAEHKRPIPKIPSVIGIITSPTGAAVRDIINVLKRRFPFSKVLIYPSLVQGEGAPSQLVKALEFFERTRCADVVIIGRGGGSIEDLWAFNDEYLARVIFDMTVPVISAVGHEIDFTICDFVADLRAPTPSAAAELAVPDMHELLTRFDNVNRRMAAIVTRRIDYSTRLLESLVKSPVFTDATYFTQKQQLMLDHLNENLYKSVSGKVSTMEFEFKNLVGKLDALSPLKIMKRGYLAATTADGRAVRSVDSLSVNEKIRLRLADGSAQCIVNSTDKDQKFEIN